MASKVFKHGSGSTAAALFGVLAFVSLMAPVSCTREKQRVLSDLELRDLSGRVRTAVTRLYYAVHEPWAIRADKAGLTASGHSFLSFSPEGRIDRSEYFDANGALVSATEFIRDDFGRTVSEKSRLADGELEYALFYEHDDRGRIVAEHYRDEAGARTGGYAYEYDEAGRLMRKLMDNSYADGSRREMETLYLYDGSGRLAEERFMDESMGGVVLGIRHSWEGGKRAYSSHYQRGRWLEYRVFYDYDNVGNVIRETGFQIPETADSVKYEALTKAEDFPPAFLISVRETEYQYYPPID